MSLKGGTKTMETLHNDYTFAALGEQEAAVEVIRNAEAALAQLTGNPTVTLIAYEKSGATHSKE